MYASALLQTVNVFGMAATAAAPAPVLSNGLVERPVVQSVRNSMSRVVTCATNSIGQAGEVAAVRALADGWNSPSKTNDLARRFAAVRALSDGWDGPTSIAPAGKLINEAAGLLSFALGKVSLVEAPDIVPVADGGLQAEWYSPAYRFEFYFEPNGEIAAWSEDRKTGVEEEQEGSRAIAMLLQWTSRLNDDRRNAAV